jgi:group I intron endonuclease
MDTGYIYTITNTVNGKKYVGQAVDYKNRWRSHRSNLKKGTHGNKYLQNSYNKYGAEAFEYRVIAVVDIELLDESEITFIKQFDSYNNGYNLTLGGGGTRGYTFSLETLEKGQATYTKERRKALSERIMGAKNHNAKLTDEQRIEIYKDDVNPSSFWAKKLGVTVQAINGVRAGRYSKHLTKPLNDEGYFHPMHLRYMHGKAKETKGKRRIAQLDLYTGKIIKIWDSLKHAQNEGKFDPRCIAQCCKGTQKIHRGFNWKYYEGAE